MSTDWINADWADVGVTAVLGLIGFYFANSYARRMKAQLAEARRSAYVELWEITSRAAPSRLDDKGREGLLTDEDRRRLYRQMTDWYYRDGNGMLLAEATQAIFLAAKRNLGAVDEKMLCPTGILDLLPEGMTLEQRRGCLSIRQLSLLRSQMKADLAIFGSPAIGKLRQHERAFLIECGVNVTPWRVFVYRIGLKVGPKPWMGAACNDTEDECCGLPK